MRPDGDPHEIRIGVSGCLLGQQVRFDGGHKRDRFLTDILPRVLGDRLRFVPVCPELAIGLGTPRECIRLVRADDGGVRLVGSRSGRDLTETMERHARARVAELREKGLHGFILKAGSPTCGRERVRIYDGNGVPTRSGTGVFARVLAEEWPQLPVEEEGRLNDARLREAFFVRVFACARLRALFGGDWRARDLVDFHSDEKLLLMAHDPHRARLLGRLVARVRDLDRSDIARDYERLFLEAVARVPRPRSHVNVLQHIIGYFRRPLDAAQRHELHSLVDEFQRGIVPLVVPITLIAHHVRRLDLSYLARQSYLDPHPRELALRSAI